MEFQFHTKAIIFNPEWKILVQKRSDTGKWDLPWWKTEVPERVECAITREIEEETWIKKIEKMKIIHIESSFLSEKNKYFILFIFLWETKSLMSVISDEHKECVRITKKELFSIWLTEYLQKNLEKIIDLF
jgi:8-oxo-dGTP pyrophosphatase MutT (NUDIX family)